MDMSLTSDASPALLAVGIFAAIVWVGPIGLFVLRRHLARARGARLAAKVLLTGLTVVTAPLAAGTALLVVSGFVETVDLFAELPRNAW
jgi:hypothetical protein